MPKKLSLWSRLKTRWHVFVYNFGWPNYVWLFDGWTAKISLAMPVVGYLVLFNDSVSAHLRFENLTGESATAFGLSTAARLKLVYLGLMFVGSASVIYRLLRPRVMSLGLNEHQYVEAGLKHFVFYTYLNFHEEIRCSGYESTITGDYHDDEWEAFKRLALCQEAGNDSKSNPEARNWTVAKAKHEDLLRSILREIYFRRVTKRRVWLALGIAVALFGYLFLLVPSADLFIKVLFVIFQPLYSGGTISQV